MLTPVHGVSFFGKFIRFRNIYGLPLSWFDDFRTHCKSKKVPDQPNEKAFPSFAGLLDFASSGILPNPREMPLESMKE